MFVRETYDRHNSGNIDDLGTTSGTRRSDYPPWCMLGNLRPGRGDQPCVLTAPRPPPEFDWQLPLHTAQRSLPVDATIWSKGDTSKIYKTGQHQLIIKQV